MTYEEALEIIKRGGSVQRDGKTYKLLRGGIHDVTNPENSVHVYMSDDDRAATDWAVDVSSVAEQPTHE